MKKFLPILLLIFSCVEKPSTPIILPQPIVHDLEKQITLGGKITRELYRSFWVLPSRDSDSIHLGIIPSEPTIEFHAKGSFRIRVHEEYQSWDIYSPQGVTWMVDQSKMIRPPLIQYFSTVEHQTIEPGKFVYNNDLLPWIERGFKNAAWVGPPKMDTWEKKDQIFRYFLSLQSFSDPDKAKEFCKTIKNQFQKKCTVIGRVDLPMFGAGRLIAKNSNFERSFFGILELIPEPDQTISVANVQTQLLKSHKKTLQIAEQIFIMPNTNNEYTLVQSVPLHTYLEGVIPSEIFPNSPMEALKSQAIIARTYTLSQLWTKYSMDPFLTCITTQCQAYYGNKDHYPQITQAIQSTKNLVLKNQDYTMAETFYHASSGGITENKQSSLGGHAISYKGGTLDTLNSTSTNLQNEDLLRDFIQKKNPTYCSVSTFSKDQERWTKSFSKKELLHLFTTQPTNITVTKRGVSGRALALKVEFQNKKPLLIEGELNIRKKFNALPSSMFVMNLTKSQAGLVEHLTLYGRGRGHGVGLSQQGAIGRAQAGQSYHQILSAYYPGTRLDTILSQK